jgi:hypothetical protein
MFTLVDAPAQLASPQQNSLRDWFIMGLFAGVYVAATVYLFRHPGPETFGVWAGMVATMGGVYHWLDVRDAKTPDAPCGGGQ